MIGNVLSIAGSDPSGGAGIQADLKTFSAFGCYGMSVITALTAQNTRGVSAVQELPAAFVTAQLESIFSDIRVDAVKIGMAGSVPTIEAIAAVLEKYNVKNIVLDPVMVAQSGDRLLSDESIAALKKHLIPLADIVTPNIPEARVLLGAELSHGEENAKALQALGARAVLLKGGHESGEHSTDFFYDGKTVITLSARRVDTHNNHGTGCTLSSAIACGLAKGQSLSEAVQAAKEYITDALKNAYQLNVGHGHGPVHHFHALWGRNA